MNSNLANLRSIIRMLAERVSRRLVFKRHMPARFGGDRVYVSPGATLKLWSTNLDRVDKELFDWAQEFVSEGDVVWDIGANAGLFTFASASLAGASGHVVAVEADIWLADILRRSAQFASLQRAPVSILPVAISGVVDIARLNIANRSRASNFLSVSDGSSQSGGVRETQLVMSVTLDWLCERLPTPKLVKIDVEGAEYDVLKGGNYLLSDVRPVILCEVASANSQRVSDLLHAHGYHLFNLADKDNRKPIQVAAFNTVAHPMD